MVYEKPALALVYDRYPSDLFPVVFLNAGAHAQLALILYKHFTGHPAGFDREQMQNSFAAEPRDRYPRLRDLTTREKRDKRDSERHVLHVTAKDVMQIFLHDREFIPLCNKVVTDDYSEFQVIDTRLNYVKEVDTLLLEVQMVDNPDQGGMLYFEYCVRAIEEAWCCDIAEDIKGQCTGSQNMSASLSAGMKVCLALLLWGKPSRTVYSWTYADCE